jgi:nickel transport protein
MIMRATTALAIVFMLSSPAWAHGVSIHAHDEGGRIHAESYYMDGRPCGGCQVKVIEKTTGNLILSGKTDSRGIYVFNAPDVHGISLELIDNTGHKARYALHIDEQHHASPPPSVKDEETLREIERAVEDKVAPLREEISRLRKKAERPGLTEVLGGMGYIIGLFGLWALMRSGKKQ